MTVSLTAKEIAFGPFRLDAANARLLRDGRPVALTPKALDVLHHLASRPDRLVTKDELLTAVWPDVIVSDASIKVCVREIREALDDDAKAPTYIETVHRRGYRFIAKVEAVGGAAAPGAGAKAQSTTLADAMPQAAGQPEARRVGPARDVDLPPTELHEVAPPAPQCTLVGRRRETERLEESFRLARWGRRQCVFVAGGPESGKTALVEAFSRHAGALHAGTAHAGAPAVVLAGHCFEQFGTSEPYMPVWEAVARLARGRETPSPVLDVLLARHAAAYAAAGSAPNPSLSAAGQPAAPGPRGAGERLLREMADGIEALAAEAPAVLLLEDVHWADYSTIDLISALARRRSPARLLIVATYRPAEIVAAEHPLRGVVHGLVSAGLAREMALDFLDEPAVAQFLAARFPGNEFPAGLARRLHQRTEGHPLFLVHLVEDLVAQGVFVERDGAWQLDGADGAGDEAPDEHDHGPAHARRLAVLETRVPDTVRAMIEGHLERLSPGARQVLEAAAVAGVAFSAAAAAAALAADVVHVEQACDELARRHRFLAPLGVAEWPDGTAATRYRFVHELYHNVVYQQVPVARRVRMHQLVGLTIESAWGHRAAEEAAGLAMHFEMGRDWHRAVKYLRLAAHAAGRHYAHREAAHYLARALAAIDRLPEEDRGEHELEVLKHLGVNLQVTRGFAAPEVESVYARAYALCRASSDVAPGDVQRTFPVLWGIWLFHKVRSDLRTARRMCGELLEMARASGDAGLLLQAHQAMCVTHLCLGDPDVTREHMEQAAAVYDPQRHAGNTVSFGQDPGVATAAFGSVALWILGRPAEALAAGERSIELARTLDQPSTLALASHFAGMLHQCRGDAAAAARWAQATIDVAAGEGFSFWLAGGHVLRGWATVARCAADGNIDDAEGGLEELRRGLDAWLATGSRTYQTYYTDPT